MLTLAALGWLLAAMAMATLWAWQEFPWINGLRLATALRRSDGTSTGAGPSSRSILTDAAWTALVSALAIVDANVGGGAWARRSTIAWMMGSWGARLVVQLLYAPPVFREPDRQRDNAPSFWFLQAKAASALFFSLPALLASVNPDPNLASVELAACGLWIVGFAGETTADRQLLRFTSNPANAGLACRAGLWRYSRNATAVFEEIIWIAYALFAFASPWGSIAFACPAVMAYRLVTRKRSTH
jgi:steroid 5-alpha reductase family enzyme